MPNITVITPPDKLFNNNPSILLIYPSRDIKDSLQEIVADWSIDFNLYLYQQEDEEHDLDWLLSLSRICDVVIFNIDGSKKPVKELASYIVANSNTYWLTTELHPVYNKLSVRRIYDLTFLKEGEISELSQNKTVG